MLTFDEATKVKTVIKKIAKLMEAHKADPAMLAAFDGAKDMLSQSLTINDEAKAAAKLARSNARKQVAQADAEKRAAEARATQAEQEARIAEMRAKVVEAEAQIPLAMAEAFRSGRLGVMDYYRMENIQSDTAMRTTISQPEAKK